jgi:hypothetical protein
MPRRFFAALRMTVLLLLVSCTGRERENTVVAANVTQVLERHTDSLMKISGVVGTAEGSCAGRPCILVLVERDTPAIRKAVPAELDGIQVDIRESGRIQAR